jgi:hypothetical protein
MLSLGLIGLVLASQPTMVSSVTSARQSRDAAYAELLVRDLTEGRLRFVLTVLMVSTSSVATLFFLWKRQAFSAAASVGLASVAAVSLWKGFSDRNWRNYARSRIS